MGWTNDFWVLASVLGQSVESKPLTFDEETGVW